MIPGSARTAPAPILGESQVVLLAADAIGMALYFDLQTGMARDDARHPRQLFTGTRFQRVSGSVEQDIGHVHDQSTGGIARLQDRVELIEQLLAELRLFLLRLLPQANRFGRGLMRGVGLGRQLLLLGKRRLACGVRGVPFKLRGLARGFGFLLF